MRIAVGAMMHETNTFTPLCTDFSAFTTASSLEDLENPQWETCSVRGIVERLLASRVEVAPTFFARAIPSGRVRRDAFTRITEEIMNGVRRAGRPDGICLALHGSMSAEGSDDPEGELLASVRRQVGPETPIICALDLHATITVGMAAAADAFTVYRTAPHTDAYETGERAADLVLASMNGQKQLLTEWISLPMMLPGERSETGAGPMCDLIQLLAEAESMPGVLSADYTLGFPWADSPHNSVGIVVTGTRPNRRAIRSSAKKLAGAFWERRFEFDFTTEACSLDEAIKRAMADAGAPVVISDTGDNPTAGAAQDTAFALCRLIELGITGALVVAVVSPEAMQRCRQAGEGDFVPLEFGGPLQVTGRVLALCRVRGIDFAVVDCGGVVVVFAGARFAVTDPALLEEIGIIPQAYKIIVIKSGYLSPAYRRLAARAILALTPGETDLDLAALSYTRTPRPIFPLDPETVWP